MPRTRNAFLLSTITIGILGGVLLTSKRFSTYDLPTSSFPSTIQSADAFSWEKLPPSRRLDWQPCYSERQCARFIVPLDYDDPDGREAIIALIRKPSEFEESSPHYRGPVLFNPGGPGGSGVDLILGRGDSFSTILGPQFDIVSFDPRGIARSTPRASFFKSDVERVLWDSSHVGHSINASESYIGHVWARAHVVGQLAAETDDGYLRHINTENTARDMLRIVEAHGRDKIQYWGFSYGSVLGATFAALFPDRIERLVIDGVADSEDYYATLWSNNLLDTDKAFNSFLTGCVDAGPENCKFWAPTPEDIERNITALYNSLASKPIPMKTEKSYGLLDYSMLRSIIFSALYSPYATFPSLAEGLAALAAGDGTGIFDAASSAPYECDCGGSKQVSVRDATSAVACNDGEDVPGDLQSTQEYYERISNASSWVDRWEIRYACIGWPKFPKNHFQGPFVGNTSHPILLVGNTADPVTPLWAAKKMSKGFKDSVVLTQNSAGHCSISAPSVCTQTHIRNYFIHGSLPEPDTVCEPIGTPFSAKSKPKAKAQADERALGPGFDLNDHDDDGTQRPLEDVTVMTEDEKELFAAVSELSRMPFVPHFPSVSKF